MTTRADQVMPSHIMWFQSVAEYKRVRHLINHHDVGEKQANKWSLQRKMDEHLILHEEALQ